MVLILFGVAIAIFGVDEAEGFGESTTASCVNLIRIVGAEKPNPFTRRFELTVKRPVVPVIVLRFEVPKTVRLFAKEAEPLELISSKLIESSTIFPDTVKSPPIVRLLATERLVFE